MPYILLLLFLSVFTPVLVEAQECGTTQLHQYLLEHNESYRLHFQQLKKSIQEQLQFQQAGKPSALGGQLVYTIPVVVHVIHLGEPVGTGSNISDAQIQGAIDGINSRFANTIGTGVNVGIQFCLAKRDPNGCPTNGIVRVNGSSVPNYAADGIQRPSDVCTGALDTAVKDLSKWPVLQYYNIWVTHKICGNNAGYAYYPWGGAYDGAVFDRNYFINNSTIPTHELGHGLFLAHTFEGDGNNAFCPVDTNCNVDGDWICDTPPHKANDCGSTNPCTSAGVWDNSRRNYMSYCNTRTRFTALQRDRMRLVMEYFPRADLVTSTGCQPSTFNTLLTKNNVSCSGACNGVATATPVCSGSYTYLWSTGDTTPTITNLCPGSYTVTVIDAAANTATFSIQINEPAPLTTENTVLQHINCHGQAGGMATVTVAGGTSPYTVTWSNNQTSDTLRDVTAGQYVVTVADANGCLATDSVTITQPLQALQTTTTTTEQCTDCLATALASVTGGTSPYTVNWSNNASGIGVQQLCAGTYSYTVTDALGCSTSDSFQISVKAVPVLSLNAQPDTVCIGDTVQLSASGAVSYLWWPGSKVSDSTSATPKAFISNTTVFTVAGTAANGCADTAAIEVIADSCITIGFENHTTEQFCKLYPNPVAELLFIQTATIISQSPAITIYNHLGQKVMNVTLANTAGRNILPISVSSLAAGLYYLRIQSGPLHQVFKFVKE